MIKTAQQKAGEACRDQKPKDYYSKIAKGYWKSREGLARRRRMSKGAIK